ncbi:MULTISPECIES: DUF3558 family protein [unclassified Streptomyces]
MQRRAQRDQRDDQSVQRTGRLRAALAVAAVPVMLVAAGCSGDSGSGSDDGGSPAAGAGQTTSASSSAAPTVPPAAYKTLPKVCDVLSKKTLEELVPEAKAGKAGNTDDTSTRANCSWDSLKNNGVKGSQFRWLNVSLLRFESDIAGGAADQQAHAYYEKQVKGATSVQGAAQTRQEPLAGTGNEATSVRYDLKKKEGAFKQQTVVARVENVVVTVDYNGAGLAGDKTPDADDLTKAAQKAAKEAVASVTAANTGTGSGSAAKPSSGAPSPSASAAKS